MSNPFADPPQPSPNPFGDNPYQAPYSPFPSGPRRGLINHVRIIVVLNAVQGCLELFMAGMFAFLCFVFSDTSGRFGPMNGPADEHFVVAGVIGIIAVLILIVSLLRIYAAIMNFSFKRRALGITSLILGLGTCLTFYCALTSIALAVYGLIVMMNQEVAEAFKMRAEGRSSDDILREFNNRPA